MNTDFDFTVPNILLRILKQCDGDQQRIRTWCDVIDGVASDAEICLSRGEYDDANDLFNLFTFLPE